MRFNLLVWSFMFNIHSQSNELELNPSISELDVFCQVLHVESESSTSCYEKHVFWKILKISKNGPNWGELWDSTKCISTKHMYVCRQWCCFGRLFFLGMQVKMSFFFKNLKLKKKHVFKLLHLIFQSFQLQNQEERVILPHKERSKSFATVNQCNKKTIFKCDRGGRQRVKQI